MTTTTKSFTFTEVLEAEIGSVFKISTDNALYGITVEKTPTALINQRTGDVMQLTSDLFNSKFRPVALERELSVLDMLVAYNAGERIKIDSATSYRFVKKEEVPESIKNFIKNVLPNGIHAFREEDVISFEELTNAKFYLA